jgi:type II secretory pathway predicted ATPase ExeA
MKAAATDISIIGKLFTRTALGSEMRPPQWQQIIADVIGLGASATTLMCVFANDGAGKTTFLQLLQEYAHTALDVVLIVPGSPSTNSGWLMEAMSSWLSSSTSTPASASKILTALAESSRPILLCVDSGDAIQDQHLAGDLAAMLNLADSCGLKLSILVCCSESKANVLSVDKSTASRMIYKKMLPAFSEDQILEFLAYKIRQMGYSNDLLAASKRADLATAANGSPMEALKIFSAHLGHVLPVQNKHGTPVREQVASSAAAKKPEQHKKAIQKDSEKPSRIEDLLAPRKA